MKLTGRQALFSLSLIWTLVCWVGTDWYATHKTEQLLQTDTEALESDSLALYQAFDERLNYLAALPVLVGKDSAIVQAATRYTQAPADGKQAERYKETLNGQPDLAALNTELRSLATQLKVDVVFVLNRAGYCIAASNSETPESFVGTNYTDRLYVKGAIRGEPTHQYVVGRKTNIPGLIYSAPIMGKDGVLGVMAVKANIADFQPILSPYQAFLTDGNDVIVLSSEPKYLNHMLEGARFNQLSDEARLQQYKRTDFPVLPITHWDPESRLPTLRLPNHQSPILGSVRAIPGDNILLHIFQDASGIQTIQHERIIFFITSALAGFALFSLIYQLAVYLSALKRGKTEAEAESERLNESLSEREQQLETILDHLPVMVVARDPQTQAVISSNRATQTILERDAPLPVGKRYAESLNPQLATELTKQDQAVERNESASPQEVQLGDKILLSQTVAAKDTRGQPHLLIDLVEDITQKRQDEAEIRRLAFIDTLTGINNRTSFQQHLESVVTQAVARHHFGALILIDLDAFKQINDRLGHGVGDELLKEMAQRIQSEASDRIFIARLASDEFVVVIDAQSASASEATHIASRLANTLLVKITRAYHLAHQTLHVTASLGATLFGSGLADTADLVLAQADAAMYEAKRRQRGTIHFFNEDTQKYLNEQADLTNRLRGALKEDLFQQVFQPQVDHTGHVIGVEALLRWHDATLGQVPPSRFIPLAESLHLIVDIDRWVLAQACRLAGAWRNHPILSDVVISVNVSAEFFSQNDFVDQVIHCLGGSHALPGQMMIEITEGTIVEDTENNILKIKTLQDAGLEVAIDDFGTGNSSLAYINRFVVDQIKIDQRFVRDLTENERSKAIAAFIIQLAKTLGYRTLAEGVETEGQKACLDTLGCDFYQGFLYSTPLPLADCEQYILQKNR